MESERTELIILLESIKENIKHNPGKGIWAGIVMVNGLEYRWKVTERPIGIMIEEKE
jgi:hypothetical protein